MLTRWSDWSPLGRFEARDPLESFRRELGRLLFDFEGPAAQQYAQTPGAPRFSFEEAGNDFVLRAEVPGLTEKELELNVDGQSITLKGERSTNVPEGYSVHRRERGNYRFARSFALPARVDADKATAQLQNGVLTVTVPKAAEAQARKIQVKVS